MQSKQPKTTIIILAAGLGTRMGGNVPKAQMPLGGLPLLGHVLNIINEITPAQVILVLGNDMKSLGEFALKQCPAAKIQIQEQRLGTGHALRCALDLIDPNETDALLVLYGDTPFIDPAMLIDIEGKLQKEKAKIVIAAFEAKLPNLYGRLIVNSKNQVEAIIEAKEASEDVKKITLCNGGIMGFQTKGLHTLIHAIKNDNAKGEYYLTDAVALAKENNKAIAYIIGEEASLQGIDTPTALAAAEAKWQQSKRQEMLEKGVLMLSPETVYFSHDTDIEAGALIEQFTVFGTNVKIRKNAIIKAFSHLEGCQIGEDVVVGPYARLRPETILKTGAKVGNFVELKKTIMEEGAKVNHLSYIGDAMVGEKANIGAGTITCNYDGFNKHQTKIGAGAFIGSNSALIAPLEIGKGAMVAAGSVISKSISDDALGLTRPPQKELPQAAKKFRNRQSKLKGLA